MALQGDETDTIRLRYSVRGLVLLSTCTILTVGIAAAGVASATATHGTGRESWVLLAALTLGCAAVTAVSAGATWRASQRLAAVDDAALTSTGGEALLDVMATAGDGLAYVAGRVGLPSQFEWVIPARIRAGMRAFYPQDHPWRFATLIALSAGSAVPALNLAVLALTGRVDNSHLGQLATSAPALITFEAALVLTGYATHGRYLGYDPPIDGRGNESPYRMVRVRRTCGAAPAQPSPGRRGVCAPPSGLLHCGVLLAS